jgi:hypothetical protein
MPLGGWVGYYMARLYVTLESEEHLREYVDELGERVAKFPRGGIDATKTGI